MRLAILLPAPLLFGCTDPVPVLSSVSCEGPSVASGTARVCRLGAGDVPDGSGGRPGDYRLQNALLDVIIRGEQASLTRLSGTGGTVIGMLPESGEDPLLELQPVLEGDWFTQVELTALPDEDDGAALRLTGLDADGVQTELTYRLAPDSHTLHLDGARGFRLVPRIGAERVGNTVEQGDTLLIGGGEVEDPGGELWFSLTDRVTVGSRREAVEEALGEVIEVDGVATDAEWVEAWRGGDRLLRLPVGADGAFAGPVPAETSLLVPVAEGRRNGVGVAPGAGLALAAGPSGLLRVRAVDDAGLDLFATVRWGDQVHVIPPGGAALPVGPGVEDALVWAGPAFEAAWLGALEVPDDGEAEASVLLRRVTDTEEAVLARIGEQAWPDVQERRWSADILESLVGQGVGYAVLVADDEIAQDRSAEPHVADAVAVRSGSRAATDAVGQPVAWPWTANTAHAAHGAAPWPGLSADDLLAVMRGTSPREVVVDLQWLAAAQDIVPGAVPATALRLSGPQDTAAWLAWVDDGLALPVVGPWTWVEGLDAQAYSAVDVEARIYQGATIATTGPRIRVDIDGAGPGERVATDDMPVGEVVARIRVDTPAWAPVDRVLLHGPDGEVLARWDAAPGPTPVDLRFDVEMPEWLVVEAIGSAPSPLTGEVPWAVSTPVWRD